MLTFGVNVVVLKNEKVLLTLRSDFPVWCLPGGAIEDGESLVEAAQRETFEETGAEVEIERIVGVYSRPHWRNGGNHEVVFKGTHVAGDLVPQDGEALEIAYFGLDELPKHLLWWHHDRIFDAVGQETAVARTQDARWALDGVSYQEGKQMLANGQLSEQDLIAYFCQKPSNNKSYLEL